MTPSEFGPAPEPPRGRVAAVRDRACREVLDEIVGNGFPEV